MTLRELAEWGEFAAIEPIGGYRLDVNVGSLVAELRATALAFAGKSTPVKLSDCILDFDPKPEKPPGESPKAVRTVQQMKDVMTLAMRAQEAYVKRHG